MRREEEGGGGIERGRRGGEVCQYNLKYTINILSGIRESKHISLGQGMRHIIIPKYDKIEIYETGVDPFLAFT